MATLNLFPARIRFTNADGTLTPEAYRALQVLFQRVGGALGDNGSDVFAVFGGGGDADNLLGEVSARETVTQSQSVDECCQFPDLSQTAQAEMLFPDVVQPVNEINSAALAESIHGATSKPTPVDADELPLADSASSFSLKKLTWANLKATVKTYLSGTAFPIGGTTPDAGTFNALTVTNGLPAVTANGTTGSGFRGYRVSTSGTEVATFFADPSSGELRITSGFAGFGGFQTFYVNGVEGMRLDVDGNLKNIGSHTIGSYTVATRPAHAAGKLIYVSDGGAGANFQGSTGSAWVNLG